MDDREVVEHIIAAQRDYSKLEVKAAKSLLALEICIFCLHLLKEDKTVCHSPRSVLSLRHSRSMCYPQKQLSLKKGCLREERETTFTPNQT